MFGRIGITELVVIFGIVILLFGARRLPQIGSGLGKAIRNFKQGHNEDNEDDNDDSHKEHEA